VTPDSYVSNRHAIVERLAREIADASADAIADRGHFAIALPGGSVATECFPSLARLPLDWSQVQFFWADERAVPPSDPESNYGLADRLWLTPARVPAASIHRMPADRPDLAAAADEYATELTSVLGTLPRLDVALLGLGPDGHVASLFPGHPILDEEDRLVAAVTDAPKPPPRRLTLTMPVLAHSARLIVVAFGSSKAGALAEAVQHKDSALPVAKALRLAASPVVLADEEAGAGLNGRW
jgi:6-phosphogluconolactonase